MKLRPRKGEPRFTREELVEWNAEVCRHPGATLAPRLVEVEEVKGPEVTQEFDSDMGWGSYHEYQ